MSDMNMNVQQNNTAAPQNTKIDDKAIKKIAGEAISQAEGVLGVDGGLADILKGGNDVTKGLSINLSDDNQKVSVSTKIITEYGKNIPNIVSDVQNKVADAIQRMAGLTVEKVSVEVTDTMTREDYKAKTAPQSKA